MFRDGKDVEVQVCFFLVSIGDYSAIFDGEIHVKKVKISRGNNLCDIPFRHSKIADVAGKGSPVST